MPVGLIRIVISPWTTVPVGTDQDAVCEVRAIAGDDVGGTEHRAVVAFEQGFLGSDTHAIGLELLHDPCATIFMGLTVHGTRTKFALGLTESEGAVSTEGRTCGLEDSDVVRGGLLAKTAGCYEEGGRY